MRQTETFPRSKILIMENKRKLDPPVPLRGCKHALDFGGLCQDVSREGEEVRRASVRDEVSSRR